ncbi:MAG TPA: hypothetical protein ACFCUC_01250, partial [Desulfobacterales bacterium]
RYIDQNGRLHGLPAGSVEAATDGAPPADASDNSYGWIPEPMRDHVPLLYAIHLWNNMVLK